MTSHNKHHGGFQVVLGQRYKNAHNFIINDQTCLELFSMGFQYHNLFFLQKKEKKQFPITLQW